MDRLQVALLTVALLWGCSAMADERPTNVVVAIQGKVLLQRDGWTGRSPLGFGTVVRLGDLLEPQGDGKATILCANLTLVSSVRVIGGVPCDVDEAVIRWNGARLAPARSARTDFPVLLSPRATDIVESRPWIRWLQAENVSEYRVTIEGANVKWTSPVVTGGELAYPNNAPVLEPEMDYQVSIVGGGRSSREEGLPGSGFRIAGAKRLADLKVLEQRVRALELSDNARRLAVSHLYAAQRLLSEAVEAMTVPGVDSGVAELNFLGELYVRLQRLDLAEAAFKKALDLSQPEDIEGGAFARKMLGRLIIVRDQNQARTLLDEALRSYSQLGDRAAVAEVKRLLPQ